MRVCMCIYIVFLRLHLRHMEVPRLEAKAYYICCNPLPVTKTLFKLKMDQNLYDKSKIVEAFPSWLSG